MYRKSGTPARGNEKHQHSTFVRLCRGSTATRINTKAIPEALPPSSSDDDRKAGASEIKQKLRHPCTFTKKVIHTHHLRGKHNHTYIVPWQITTLPQQYSRRVFTWCSSWLNISTHSEESAEPRREFLSRTFTSCRICASIRADSWYLVT